MSKTTIELPEELRDRLRDERKPHESNYAETIARLLGDGTGGSLWTEREIRDICQQEIQDATRQ